MCTVVALAVVSMRAGVSGKFVMKVVSVELHNGMMYILHYC